jgi:lysophospholipase L1-like esterase
MTNLLRSFCLVLISFGLSLGAPAQTIAIIGDSTVCNYPTEHACRGWGQFLKGHLKDSVRVVNLAKSGRSTRTFIKDGLWAKTLAEKADFVLIQFGHNDSHGVGRPESTDAATDYRDFLRRYIDEARAAGAVPVLVTPMHRRTYREGKLVDSLQPYADAMKAVAAEKAVGLVDLHTASGRLFRELGEQRSADLASAPGDRTHFNERGARAMAELVVKELPVAEPKLKPLVK